VFENALCETFALIVLPEFKLLGHLVEGHCLLQNALHALLLFCIPLARFFPFISVICPMDFHKTLGLFTQMHAKRGQISMEKLG